MFIIEARRWRQPGTGNVYHSVRVATTITTKNLVTEWKPLGNNGFSFGGDNQYLDTALEILQEVGHFKKSEEYMESGIRKDRYEFMRDLRKNPGNYYITVVNVGRKSDL